MWTNNPYGYACKIERFAGSGTTADPYRYRVAADYANRPVNYVSFGDSCRFANWLHNGQPGGAQNVGTTEDGAYALNGATTNQTLEGVARKSGWRWAVTSEEEWYKAAYYEAATSSYYDYPTGSNSVPSNDLLTPDGGNNANFSAGHYTIGSPYYCTPVGAFALSDSPYGTFDQGGNVWEWNEAGLGDMFRGQRGGAYNYDGAGYLHASYRTTSSAEGDSGCVGFRVVEVPVPGDVDGNGHVDVVDLLYLVAAFGSMTGDARYDTRCDFNQDGAIDVIDLLDMVYNFGT